MKAVIETNQVTNTTRYRACYKITCHGQTESIVLAVSVRILVCKSFTDLEYIVH